MFLKIRIDIKELTESEYVWCSGSQQKATNRFLQRTVHDVKKWDGYFSVSAASNSILKDLRTGTDGFASLKGTCRPLAWLRSLKILIYSMGDIKLITYFTHD